MKYEFFLRIVLSTAILPIRFEAVKWLGVECCQLPIIIMITMYFFISFLLGYFVHNNSAYLTLIKYKMCLNSKHCSLKFFKVTRYVIVYKKTEQSVLSKKILTSPPWRFWLSLAPMTYQWRRSYLGIYWQIFQSRLQSSR